MYFLPCTLQAVKENDTIISDTEARIVWQWKVSSSRIIIANKMIKIYRIDCILTTYSTEYIQQELEYSYILACIP